MKTSRVSMFLCATEDDVKLVVEAVRRAGKRGKLAAAALEIAEIESLGLEIVSTPGTTPDEAANALHIEARLSQATADLARRMGQQPWEFYNQQLAAEVYARAKVIYQD